MHEKSAFFIKLLKREEHEIRKKYLRIFLYLFCVCIPTSFLYNMCMYIYIYIYIHTHTHSPAVLSPGLEVNFATSTIFTAKICPV